MPEPAPVSASAQRALGTWSVLFDTALQAGALNAGNWILHPPEGGSKIATVASAAGNTVSGNWVGGIGAPGAGTIDYVPPPFDVLSVAGQPALGFAGFSCPVAT